MRLILVWRAVIVLRLSCISFVPQLSSISRTVGMSQTFMTALPVFLRLPHRSLCLTPSSPSPPFSPLSWLSSAPPCLPPSFVISCLHNLNRGGGPRRARQCSAETLHLSACVFPGELWQPSAWPQAKHDNSRRDQSRHTRTRLSIFLLRTWSDPPEAADVVGSEKERWDLWTTDPKTEPDLNSSANIEFLSLLL